MILMVMVVMVPVATTAGLDVVGELPVKVPLHVLDDVDARLDGGVRLLTLGSLVQPDIKLDL